MPFVTDIVVALIITLVSAGATAVVNNFITVQPI
jgi:hypothetical protein